MTSNVNHSKYELFILDSLSDGKLKVATDIYLLLEGSFNITRANARKILERTTKKGIIKSSSPMTFGKGQFAYCKPGGNFTKEKIKRVSKKHRPVLYRLLVGIDINNGILSYYEALKITASPLKAGISKVDHLNELISLLEEFEIVYQKVDGNSVKYILFRNNRVQEENLIENHFAKMFVDTAFIRDILYWLIKSNLIDNENVIYRNKTKPSKGAQHNNLIWDAFGYTKTTGLNSYLAKYANAPEKQTLVVLDILISRTYAQIDLDGFLNRVQINLNSVTIGQRKVLPVIVYSNCSSLILNKIRKLGFIGFDIGSIYGSNIYEVLENIKELQIKRKLLAGQSLNEIIENILSTINVSGLEDQLKAIKGTLFEVMMLQVLRHQYPNSEIVPNFYYSRNNKRKEDINREGYEYDFLIKSSNPKEIVVVELKGYKSSYQIPRGDYKTKNTTGWFFNKTLPFIKEKFNSDITEGYSFTGCYITSSDYSQEAIDDLEKLQEGALKPSRMDIYYNREKLFKLLSENDFLNLKNIIEKFYK